VAVDRKRRLASLAYAHAHGAGRVRVLGLYVLGRDARGFETRAGLAAERVEADAGGHGRAVAEQPRHVREVGRRAAQAAAFGQQVPDKLAEPYEERGRARRV